MQARTFSIRVPGAPRMVAITASLNQPACRRAAPDGRKGKRASGRSAPGPTRWIGSCRSGSEAARSARSRVKVGRQRCHHPAYSRNRYGTGGEKPLLDERIVPPGRRASPTDWPAREAPAARDGELKPSFGYGYATNGCNGRPGCPRNPSQVAFETHFNRQRKLGNTGSPAPPAEYGNPVDRELGPRPYWLPRQVAVPYLGGTWTIAPCGDFKSSREGMRHAGSCSCGVFTTLRHL